MGFNNFKTGVIVRVILLSASIIGFAYLLISNARLVTLIIMGIIIALVLGDLIRYVEVTNKKLTRFLESIRFSDFSSGFAYDNMFFPTKLL